MSSPQRSRLMGPTWGPPGSCRPQMGPMLAPWTLLSGSLPLGMQTCYKPRERSLGWEELMLLGCFLWLMFSRLHVNLSSQQEWFQFFVDTIKPWDIFAASLGLPFWTLITRYIWTIWSQMLSRLHGIYCWRRYCSGHSRYGVIPRISWTEPITMMIAALVIKRRIMLHWLRRRA